MVGDENDRNKQQNSGRSTEESKILVVERENTCPFLLRVFWRKGGHHREVEYDEMPSKNPLNEIQIYTWRDATLKEISELLQESIDDSKMYSSRISFGIVYPDKRGRNVMRKIGFVNGNGREGMDDTKTLASVGFEIGDYLDVAILG